jgi:glycosyltransferase involved in cell wall biosynthesis
MISMPVVQIVTILSFIAVMFYIVYFRMRLAFAAKRILQPQYFTNYPVSVVIAAKNEEENLKKNLPFILNQEYAKFEVVVVDDNSTDDTYFFLKSLQQDHHNLKVIRLNENVNFFSGKKFPLSIGIRSATYNHLLFTDADCRPSSPHWIRLMVSGFSNDKQIVLGYGKYSAEKGLLNMLIRFETMLTAMQYFSFALAKIPYMGVGRNLAYQKELFNQHKGFSGHYNVVSGDDDLFINAAADQKNTACVLHPDALTISIPKTTFKKWWKQKRRHLTTGMYYKTNHKILLALYPISLLTFYVSLIFTLQDQNNLFIFLPLLIAKVIVDLVVYKNISEKFSEKKLYLISVIIEVLLIGINGMILLENIFSKQRKWK